MTRIILSTGQCWNVLESLAYVEDRCSSMEYPFIAVRDVDLGKRMLVNTAHIVAVMP